VADGLALRELFIELGHDQECRFRVHQFTGGNEVVDVGLGGKANQSESFPLSGLTATQNDEVRPSLSNPCSNLKGIDFLIPEE
jgi:hypothetical protein